MLRAPDVLSWAEIRRLALTHRRALLLANGLALLATVCSVPIPLLLPLLVDEVLLGHSGAAIRWMNQWLPSAGQTALGYLGLILALTFVLRISTLIFN
ncbi:MAG: ABC transporter ATP-binding protein, partial [Pseudomonas sp.]